MKITIEEVEQISRLLMERLKAASGNELEIGDDYFWNVPVNDRYDPYKQPGELTMGQISEDIEILFEKM